MSVDKLLAVAVLAVLGFPVGAQPTDTGRGVVRISLLNGDVSVRRGDSGDYIAAAVNAPLVVQDRLLTGPGSRAELQFDWANFLRLSHDAEVRLADLQFQRYMVQVARGTATWRVLRDSEASIEISTPSVSVRPVRRGTYRITVHADGSSEITVRDGEAEIFTPRGSERLRSGRTMFARGTTSEPEFRIGEEVPDDEWDKWNVTRDRDLERSRSYQYMSRDIYGAEDLDNHGSWVNVSSYGWVWSPRVAAGWAPYRYGRWTWMDWYGWSWVSHDPWGWAPYHYGRWFWHAPVGWCWWPGSVGVRHYWSPGFVAFVGFGGVGVGVGWGRVGWVPIGPREPFYPWWGSRWYGGYRHHGYVNNSVTVVNNVNITNIYRNSRIDNAVTVVDQDGFRRGRFSDPIRVSNDEIRNVSVARGPVPVAPERESLRLADREASIRGTDRTGAERFFSRSRPVDVDRVSFDDQRRGIEQIARRNFGDGVARGFTDGANPGVRSGAEATGSARSAVDGAPSAADSVQRGWRRVEQSGNDSGRAGSGDVVRGVTGTPSGTAQAGERSVVDGASDGGWRRFGSPRATGSDVTRTPAAAERSGDRSGVARGADTDWRRFGSPRLSGSGSDDAVRGLSGSGTARGFDNPNGDRRGSDSGRPTESTTRSPDNSDRGAAGDWRRFGGGTRSSDVDRGSPRNFDSSSPGSGGDRGGDGGRGSGSSRMERRDWNSSPGADRGESLRISPPIVRERGDGSGRGGSQSMNWGSGGGRSSDSSRTSPSGMGGGGMRGGDGGGRSAPGGGGRSGSGGGGGRGGSGGR